jgi:hypothetical protein
MKNIYKAALTVVFGLATIGTLKASTGFDLLIGFTQQGANSGAADLYYDIGPVFSYPGQTGLANGQTWNLSSVLTAQHFNLGGTNFQWGVVGDANSQDLQGTSYQGDPETTWITTPGLIPGTINGDSAFAQRQIPVNAIENVFGDDGQTTFSSPGQSATVGATAYNSWNEETINGSQATQIINAYGYSPNVVGTNGVATLWQIFDNNSSPTNLGHFTLSAAGILTFNTGGIATAPRPLIVNIIRLANTSTVYFTTTNGSFTYSLVYTNSVGLQAPISTWPAGSTTVTGNGLTNSLQDTTTTTNRFYMIKVL